MCEYAAGTSGQWTQKSARDTLSLPELVQTEAKQGLLMTTSLTQTEFVWLPKSSTVAAPM